MTEVINIQRIDLDGKVIPANNPNYAVPSHIKFAQLRYNTFSSSYAVQGVFLTTGESSTIEFNMAGTEAYSLFKLFTSTDGVTYAEDKTYGGNNGKTIFQSIAGAVLTTGNQTIGGVKTFSSIPISAGTPTTNTQLVNKSYVDNLQGGVIKLNLNQYNVSPIVIQTIFNNTGYSITNNTRNAIGDYNITFSGTPFATLPMLEYSSVIFDGGTISTGIYVQPNSNTLNIQTNTLNFTNPGTIGVVGADELLTNFSLTVRLL